MPVINNTTSPAIRTTIQAALAEGVIRLVETIPDPDLDISVGDRTLWWVIVTGVISLVQNLIENKTSKAILFPQRTAPLMPENAPEDLTK